MRITFLAHFPLLFLRLFILLPEAISGERGVLFRNNLSNRSLTKLLLGVSNLLHPLQTTYDFHWRSFHTTILACPFSPNFFIPLDIILPKRYHDLHFTNKSLDILTRFRKLHNYRHLTSDFQINKQLSG